MFVSYAVALRKSFANDPSFRTGGVLWFKDLTIPDGTCMLAIACTASSLLAIHLSSKPPTSNNPGAVTSVSNTNVVAQFFQIVTVCLCPILTYVNSGLLLYWLTSSLFGIGINQILRIPTVRELIGLNMVPRPLTPAMQEYAKYLKFSRPVAVDRAPIKFRQRSRR